MPRVIGSNPIASTKQKNTTVGVTMNGVFFLLDGCFSCDKKMEEADDRFIVLFDYSLNNTHQYCVICNKCYHDEYVPYVTLDPVYKDRRTASHTFSHNERVELFGAQLRFEQIKNFHAYRRTLVERYRGGL